MISPSSAPRVVVIGGSLGGLMAALALRGVGCDVDVFERVPQRLEGQGAGLRIVPDMARLLQERAGIDLAEVSTFVSRFRHVGADNRILSEVASPGQFTSWGSLHRALTARFDPDRYHFGDACIAIEQQDDRVLIRFASGRMESADLVVFADGILSTGRRLLASQLELEYAGYVTWRGFVAENDVSNETRDLLADSICYCTIDYSHIGMYPIPDPGNSGSAARHINFVWYRNVASGPDLETVMTDRTGAFRPISVPAGAVPTALVSRMKADAQDLLPAMAADIVVNTREPFLQALYDVVPQRMVYGRACLIGDAAFATRPHAGAATAKAAVNAWSLADCLDESQGDVAAALAAWEPDQLQIGQAFVERNQMMGRRSLVENRYNPTAPDQMPGLYGPGR